MKVKQLLERVGTKMATGRAIAYIKDGLEEMNLIGETHVKSGKIDIVKNKRFYDLPFDLVRILDVRCKDHENEDSTYRSIPRMIHEPVVVDTDGE
tara:strand:+ start:743 stop:1027 length:285 start_codon:yes stop_codon:yes gene_type:complete